MSRMQHVFTRRRRNTFQNENIAQSHWDMIVHANWRQRRASKPYQQNARVSSPRWRSIRSPQLAPDLMHTMHTGCKLWMLVLKDSVQIQKFKLVVEVLSLLRQTSFSWFNIACLRLYFHILSSVISCRYHLSRKAAVTNYILNDVITGYAHTK